mgnify:CR=1 FL=1
MGPTVAALRDHAAGVVSAELVRLWRRTPDLTDSQRSEVDRTVHRIVDKLLHTPTTRVRELAGAGESVSYAAALSDLFDLPGRTRPVGPGETLIAADVPDGRPGEWS